MSPLRDGWGEPTSANPDLAVAGADHALAEALTGADQPLVRFRPEGSDLARSVGVRARPSIAVPMDLLRTDEGIAVNAVILGVAPDATRATDRRRSVEVRLDGEDWYRGRATGVVVANGQYVRGADLVPRGHPGDGRVEVQVYALEPRQRRALRARVRTGAHLPHPDVHTATCRTVEVRAQRPLPLEMDGRPAGRRAALRVEVVPGAYRLLV